MARPQRKKGGVDHERLAKLLGNAQQYKDERKGGYRDKALALFPHVCGRCAREFDGKDLRELTVHHKDHNHDNNPPDGSNWELLCVYCHDDEHQDAPSSRQNPPGANDDPSPQTKSNTRQLHTDGNLANNPFANLKDIVEEDGGE